MSDQDVILTPWHHIVLPSGCPLCPRDAKGNQPGHGVVRHRLAIDNPAVLDAADRRGNSWDAMLRTLVDQGATDDEIWAGGWRDLLPIQLRRHLVDLIEGIRKEKREEVTPDAVRAERQRRMDGGEPHGYDALARHFGLSVGAIRTRLGAR